MLEDAGYVGVVAVNSELEIARYLRPGDVLQNVQILEDVSEEKQTALGIGHFVTTRHRYTTDRRRARRRPAVPDPEVQARHRHGAGGRAATTSRSPRPVAGAAAAARRSTTTTRRSGTATAATSCGSRSATAAATLVYPPTPRCAAVRRVRHGVRRRVRSRHGLRRGRGPLPAGAGLHAIRCRSRSIELDEGVRFVSNIVGDPGGPGRDRHAGRGRVARQPSGARRGGDRLARPAEPAAVPPGDAGAPYRDPAGDAASAPTTRCRSG